MSNEVRVVETRFIPVDKTSSVIHLIGKAADSAGRRIDHFSSAVELATAAGGGIAAAFSFHELVGGAQEYFAAINRISRATGLAATKASALQEMLEVGGGLEGREAEQVLLNLSKRSTLVQEGQKAAQKEAKRLGIDLKKGPEAALLSMSKQAQKGKLSIGDVSRALAIRGSSAIELMDVLAQGPDEMKRMMRAATEDGAYADRQSMEVFRRMQRVRREIADAGSDIIVTVGKRAMPAMLRIMEATRDRLNSWVGVAGKFGDVLENHLETSLDIVVTIGKALLANAAIARVTGMGAVGNAKRLAGWILPGGKVINRAVESAMDAAAAGGGSMRVASRGKILGSTVQSLGGALLVPKGAIGYDEKMSHHQNLMAIFQAMNSQQAPALSTSRRIAEQWSRIKGHASDAYTRAKETFAPLIAGAGKMLLLGGGLLSVLGIQEGIMDALLDRGTEAGRRWQETFRTLEDINWQLGGITGSTSTFTKQLAELFAQAGLSSAKGLSGRVQEWKAEVDLPWYKMLNREAARMIPITWLLPKSWRPYEDEVQAGMKRLAEGEMGYREYGPAMPPGGILARDELPAARDRANYFDFRGSKFDISQEFAPGFDPDRIAAGMADDFATLGERAVQSNFSPLFTVR